MKVIAKNHIIIDNELYNVFEGEVIGVNNDGTYDVNVFDILTYKYPHVESIDCKMIFEVGDIVNVGFEYEGKKLPIIMSNYDIISE